MSSVEQIRALIEAGALRAAEEQIAQLKQSARPDRGDGGYQSAPELEDLLGEQWLRAEIAWRRGGPLVHLARAALDRDLPDDERARFGAELVRLSARAGAARWAREQYDVLAASLGHGHADLELAGQQLEIGLLEGRSPLELDALRALRREQPEQAISAYRRLADDPTVHPELRRDAWRKLALLARKQRDLARSQAALSNAANVLPESDEGARLRLLAAQDGWLAGDAASAVRGLRTLRHTLEGAAENGARYLHHHAGELRGCFERRIEQGPALRWLNGQRALRSVVSSSGFQACLELIEPLVEAIPPDGREPLQNRPSLAYLRLALARAGRPTLRLQLDLNVAEELIARELLVFVEEERSTHTGLLLLVGVDPVGRLLVFRDPALAGPVVRHILDYCRRAALHGHGALVVLPAGTREAEVEAVLSELSAAGVKEDRRLLAVDRCEVDEDGRQPPQARIATLAREAIAVAPDMPMPYKRLGEALVAQLKLGHSVGQQFDRWLLEARTRFPDAEWPFQLHAQALAWRGCYAESVIAWCDAAERDPYDERNLIGQARGLSAVGRLEQAQSLLFKALGLESAAVEAYAMAAEIAGQRGRWQEAKLLAEVGLAIQPDEPELLLVATTVAEREGALDVARGFLERAAAAAPSQTLPRLRLMRHHVDAGNWMAASDLGEMLTELAPDTSISWHGFSWVLRCMGESQRAFEAVCNGIQRCGPQAELLEQAAACIQTLPEKAHAHAVETLESLLAGSPDALMDLAVELHGRGLDDLALPLGEKLVGSNRRAPGLAWSLARLLLSDKQRRADHRGRVEGLLRESVAHGGGFAYPAGILGWLIVDRAPAETLAIVEAANPVAAPALLWQLVSRALEALGRPDDAAAARSRLVEVLPEGAIAPAALLRQLGWPDVARELLDRARQCDETHPGVLYELARTAEADGRVGEAVILIERAVEAHPADEGLLWGLLDMAFSAGKWERVVSLADHLLDCRLRDSHHEYFDPWVVRARLAAAKLALGDPEPRTELLALAARHPKVALELLRASTRHRHPTVKEDAARLEQLAEPLFRRLAKGEL